MSRYGRTPSPAYPAISRPPREASQITGHSPVEDIVQSLLCPEVHRLESTVRYLGIEVDDALEISEQTEI